MSSPRVAVLKFQLGLSLLSLTHLVFLCGWAMKRYRTTLSLFRRHFVGFFFWMTGWPCFHAPASMKALKA